MKQGKRLTRAQKECLSAHRLNVFEWMLVEETDLQLKIVHKTFGTIKTIDKFKR